ncbi:MULTISPECIES: DUF1120 domain-containing protein [Burkholderiaceae]|uniref:DUF1120 domain-containing protein n=1 Tax=Burkholderiaceae TaxID=119060 RepID=UPI0009775F3E|nr:MULTISPECIES: DUF1120 domain-containing protein [Burkholderiaceae]MCG1017431.1 DUF1120 domain-containing protein [Mycetohabitans sp. B4]
MRSPIAYAIFLVLLFSSSSKIFASPEKKGQQEKQLIITGKINPGACEIAELSPSRVNLGTLDSLHLERNMVTRLEPQDVKIGIQCTAPTSIAIRSSDDIGVANPFAIGGTLLDNATATLSERLGSLRGTLASNGKPIGVYAIELHDMRYADERGEGDAEPLGRKQGMEGWEAFDNGTGDSRLLNGPFDELTWSSDGISPVNGMLFDATLKIIPYIIPTGQLNLTDTIDFEGKTTITLTY